MTKSRTALLLFSAGAAASPATAFAQPAAATAEQMIAAYDEWYEEATDGAGVRAVRRCRREAAGEDIVVCGRTDDSRIRVPYEPVPGQVHHIAGEVPSAREAMGAGGCLRLCYQPLRVDLIDVVNALGRGLDRILHPD